MQSLILFLVIAENFHSSPKTDKRVRSANWVVSVHEIRHKLLSLSSTHSKNINSLGWISSKNHYRDSEEEKSSINQFLLGHCQLSVLLSANHEMMISNRVTISICFLHNFQFLFQWLNFVFCSFLLLNLHKMIGQVCAVATRPTLNGNLQCLHTNLPYYPSSTFPLSLFLESRKKYFYSSKIYVSIRIPFSTAHRNILTCSIDLSSPHRELSGKEPSLVSVDCRCCCVEVSTNTHTSTCTGK